MPPKDLYCQRNERKSQENCITMNTMGKTLYIQIDNNSLPVGCGEDIEMLDCRCINDFCSLVGDALVGDLKDENGKPFYRLINPVGKLLMDFKAVDEKSFNSIIEDWYDILGNLLHKGIQGDDIEIHFPQQYVDWLLHSDDPYYEQVGKELQRQNGKITLSSEAVDDDIIASLNYKVCHMFQQKNDDYFFVVFSNSIIRNSSFVIKRVKLDGIVFIRYDSWLDIIMTAPQKSFSVKGIKFKMIRVEGDSFGIAPLEQKNNCLIVSPGETEVTLSPYYIGETEVTQALWEIIMGSNPSSFKGLNRPVENINWHDCQSFIKKLNTLTGINFRLPSEKEWMVAAFGGKENHTNGYDDITYIRSCAWYQDNSGNETHPVKMKTPNELGLYDMLGNVKEWCEKGKLRGFGTLGGAFNSYPFECTPFYRDYNSSDFRSEYVGFRLAL